MQPPRCSRSPGSQVHEQESVQAENQTLMAAARLLSAAHLRPQQVIARM